MRLHSFAAPLALAAVASGALGLDLPGARGGGNDGPVFGLDVPAVADPAAAQRLRDLRDATHYPHHAASVRIARCLDEAGFPGFPVDPVTPGPVWDSTPFAPTPAQARIDGYDSVLLPLDTYGGDDRTVTNGMDGERRAAFYLALFGPDDAPSVSYSHPLVGSGGRQSGDCGSLGDAEVFGDLTAHLMAGMVVSDFEGAGRSDARRDPDFRRLTTRWARCMDRAGFARLGDPFEEVSRASGWAGGQDAGLRTGQVREIAVADADCQAALGYAAARRDVESRYVTALVREYDADITAAERTYAADARSLRHRRAGEARPGRGGDHGLR